MEPDLSAVYYPEGKAGDLYVNRRYPRSKWRISPRRATKQPDLTAPRVCGLQCVAISSSTHQRCKRRTCVDYRYCAQHLKIVKHLAVRMSKRLEKLGVPGLGLYATAPFKKGSELGDYGGEKLTRAAWNKRYNDPKDKETGAYSLAAGHSKTGFVFDGLAAASAISYANEANDVAKMLTKAKSYKDFSKMYNEVGETGNAYTRSVAGNIKMFARKDIKENDEVLVNYGPEYWGTDGMKSYITGSGWR